MKLDTMKKDKNNTRKKAKRTRLTIDIVEWRKKTAALIKEINTIKHTSFQVFAEQMDFQKDSRKAYSFVSNIEQERKVVKIPFKHNSKTITDEKKIAAIFKTNYTSKHIIPPKHKKQPFLFKEIKKKHQSGKKDTNILS